MKSVYVPFRFNADTHTYLELKTGRELPSITTLLKLGGLVDDRWFSEESCERGTHVHALTQDFDLGAITVDECVSPYRGYLLGHAKTMPILEAQWEYIEVALAHGPLGFAGRTDRFGAIHRAKSVMEVKSGVAVYYRPDEDADRIDVHGVQTALQTILLAEKAKMPAESIQRYTEYLGANGRARVVKHTKASEHGKARELLRKFAA